MISYEIDEEQKTIKCTISGEEIETGALRAISSLQCKDIALNDSLLLLKKEYTGIAKYNPDDEVPFSIDIGKEISRKKAFFEYNKDMYNTLKKLKKNLTKLNEQLLVLCFQYEFIKNDINENIKNY